MTDDVDPVMDLRPEENRYGYLWRCNKCWKSLAHTGYGPINPEKPMIGGEEPPAGVPEKVW